MGPTACGKTEFAISLRNCLPIELISVDSALIYRNMNIGTSKPSVYDLSLHPHRLLNIKDPSENYSVAEFYKDALKEIDDIIKLRKIPCLVGGTMLYYNILLNGLSVLPSSNIQIREYLLSLKKQLLHRKLKKIDPISANQIHKNDTQRLLRALEVFYLSGKNLTNLKNNKKNQFPYTIIQFAMMPPSKNWLHDRIEKRVRNMLSKGFQSEVELLFFRKDLHINLPSIRSIGYRQMWEYLEYKIDYKEMFNRIIYSTKKLAKHQLTWLKKWKDLNILSCNFSHDILIKKLLNIIQKNIQNTENTN